jgi:hypothetical protein
MKIVDCGRFYHIHEQAEEEDCKKWKCSLLIQTLESEQRTQQMVILSEHDWCPWNRHNTHIVFHLFKVFVVKHNI